MLGMQSNVMFAVRQWGQHNNAMGKAMQRLSSGLWINSAADDPSGLTMSERMKAQLRMLNNRN